jgi:nitroimidazol reductase NimA-like FMN-containing flavoprotein (pyridoxamine 5'-phosphate oxidase superfamily)
VPTPPDPSAPAPGSATAEPTGPADEATRVRRRPQRGRYDAEAVHAVLDAALVGHVGIATEAGPVVIPMLYGRVEDDLYLHGAVAGRLARSLAAGVELCLTATVVDGLVLARSIFHHSMNYRSVVVLGRAERVTDPDEGDRGLRAISDHLAPGRWDECREPSGPELRQTSVLRLGLARASVKVRTGGPGDDPEDLALDVWAGELPLHTTWGTPVPAADLAPGIPVDPSVAVLAGTPVTAAPPVPPPD